MAKRRSKARGKVGGKPSKSRRKAKKPMTAAAAKPATRRKTKAARPRKKAAAGRAGKPAARRTQAGATKMAHQKAIVIPVTTGAAKSGMAPKTDPTHPLGINFPAMPFAYSRDSVMNVLVGMLILFAIVSAGIFYPQTTTTEQALTAAAPGMMQKK